RRRDRHLTSAWCRVLSRRSDGCWGQRADDALKGFAGVEGRGRGDLLAEALFLERFEDGAEALREHRAISPEERAEKHGGIVWASVHVRDVRGRCDQLKLTVRGRHLTDKVRARGEV